VSPCPRGGRDERLIDKVIVQPLREVVRSWSPFCPAFLTGIVVFAAGLLLAWLVKLLVVRLLKLLKLDEAFARSGVTEALQKMAVKDTPEKLVGRMFFWLVAFIFFVLALSVMRVPVIDQLLGRFLLYLPNIFVALVVLALGWFLANFFGRAALIASVNAGVGIAGPLSKGSRRSSSSSRSSWLSNSSA